MKIYIVKALKARGNCVADWLPLAVEVDLYKAQKICNKMRKKLARQLCWRSRYEADEEGRPLVVIEAMQGTGEIYR